MTAFHQVSHPDGELEVSAALTPQRPHTPAVVLVVRPRTLLLPPPSELPRLVAVGNIRYVKPDLRQRLGAMGLMGGS